MEGGARVLWDMPESLLATLADSQHTMWRAMAHLAQSKLVCETHDFKRRLVEAEAKLSSNAEVIAHLEQELAQEKEQRKIEATDALQTANELYLAQQELAKRENHWQIVRTSKLRLPRCKISFTPRNWKSRR